MKAKTMIKEIKIKKEPLNVERLVYESKRLDKLVELKRLASDERYHMDVKFFANQSFLGMSTEPEFQINQRVRNVMVKELEQQIKEEGEKLQIMFNGDILE
jgi:hypothetical protein